MASLTEPAKLLLLVTLLAKDNIISSNGKAFMKELILRRDPRLDPLIEKFEKKESVDMGFLEEVHNLIGAEAQALYEDLFSGTSLEVGKTLSKREREEKDLSQEKSLIYGEVEFESFYRILRKINPARGGIFYDLGSGTGKAVFAARLTRDFDKCIGIEILSSLHEAAEIVVQRFNEKFRNFLSLGENQTVSVYEGSFCDFDWSDGDLVFANSTCFSDELMGEVSRLAGRLKPGAIVVTFTKGMTSPHFELLERKRYAMSWGPATVFIHRRLDAHDKPVGQYRLNLLPSDGIQYDPDSDYNTGYFQSNRDSTSNGGVSYDMDDIDEDDDEEADDDDNKEDDDEDDDGNEDDDEESEGSEGEDAESNEKNTSSSSPSKIYPEQTTSSKQSASLTNTPVRSPPSLKPTSNSKNIATDKNELELTAEEQLDVQDKFNLLNSPLDSMLLLRKRNSQHAHPLPQTHAVSPLPTSASKLSSVKPPVPPSPSQTNSDSALKSPAGSKVSSVQVSESFAKLDSFSPPKAPETTVSSSPSNKNNKGTSPR
jgi:SAM-dependent methyltransferase